MKKRIFGAISFGSLFLVPAFVFASTFDPIATPEPASLLLIVSGLIGVWGFRRLLKK